MVRRWFKALILLPFLATGCSEKLEFSSRAADSNISGIAPMFNSVSSSSISASPSSVGASSVDWANDAKNCNSASASVHAIKADGTIDETSILTAPIQADGSYSLKGAKSKGILLGARVKYVLKASGCKIEFFKPLLSYSNQEIGFSSSLIALTTKISDGAKNKLTDIDVSELVALETSLQALPATNLSQLINQVIASGTISAQFQSVFNIPPILLKNLPPPELDVTAPLLISEDVNNNYSVSISHWNADYIPAYEWLLDGIVVSNSASFSFGTGKNSQGVKALVLKVGSSSGGVVDGSKPVVTQTYSLTVQNSYPAIAPAMTLVGAYKRNFLSSQVLIATGTSLANCATFSRLALTESTLFPPVAIPENFPITCTASGTQLETLSIAGGDGVRTLALWALDGAGNTSATPSQINFILDRTTPMASIGNLPASVKGNSSQSVIFSASDVTSGLASIQLFYAEDGSTFTQIANLLNVSSPYMWTVPAVDVTGAKLRLVVTDQAGNTSTVTTNPFDIDSTSPILSINSPDANKRAQTGVTVSGNCEAGLNVNFSGSGLDSPLSASCNSGSFSAALVFSSSDGTKSITVSQVDAAGNEGVATRSFYRDNTGPNVAINAPASDTAARNGVYLSGVCEYSSSYSSQNTLALSGSGLASPFSTSCSSDGSFAVPVVFSGTEGAKNIVVSQTDEAGNIATSNRSFSKDSSVISLAVSAPAQSSSVKGTFTVSGVCDPSIGSGNVIISQNSGTTLTGSPISAICSSGVFSQSVTITTADGPISVRISQSDASSTVTNIDVNLTKDTAAPTLTQALITQNPKYAGTPSITFGGACETGVDVVVTGSETTSAACMAGAWSFPTSKSTDGAYTYNFSQTDAAGNATSITSLQWIRDLTFPVASLTSLTGGQKLKGNQNQLITWTATDTNLGDTPITIEYSLNGGTTWSVIATVANTGSYTWAMPGFNSSAGRVRLKVADLAGNITTAASTSNFTVDSSAPLVTLGVLSGGQIIKGGQNFIVTWTATDANFGATPITLQYSNDGGSSWSDLVAGSLANSGTYSWPVPSVDVAAARIRVTATDSLGQSASATSEGNFTIDSTPPVVTLTSHTNGQYVPYNSLQTITWNASDANFGDKPIAISISANGGSTWSTLSSNEANDGSFSWTANVATGSSYRIRITALDRAGYSTISSSTGNFTVSNGAPNLTQTTLSSPYHSKTDTSVTFGGDCETGFTITISGAESSSLSCPAGVWTFTTATVSTDAVRDYIFTQTNLAAETTSVSARWVRDTSAPIISSVKINNDDVYTSTSTVSLEVKMLESAGIQIRLANASSAASCQDQYADSNWQDQTNLTMVYPHVLVAGDGEKKVCVWAKDLAGNSSVISPATGTLNINMDRITYSSGNAPSLTAFDAVNYSGGVNQGTRVALAGDVLKISWTATDVEGLALNPIYLDYTTNGTTWIPWESGYGNLSSNLTSYSYDYYGFTAPVSTFFRLRLRVKDMAGNISAEFYSKPFNIGAWSVFAGSTGRGVDGSGKEAQISNNNAGIRFAINPKTSDVYYVDANRGLFKVSAATGLVTKIFTYGATNFGTSGTINFTTQRYAGERFLFDNAGFLYINYSGKVVRINVDDWTYTTFLPGGTVYDATATPSTVKVMTALAFDESNSMYFSTSCAASDTAFRIFKVTSNPDGTPGNLSIVAGNCTMGTAVSGQPAISQPVSTYFEDPSGTLGLNVWGNGKYIVFKHKNSTTWKVINGTLYSTTLPLPGVYNPFDQKIYLSYGNGLRAYTPNLSGANGETEDTSLRVLGTGSSPGCNDDGAARSDVCFGVISPMVNAKTGQVFFQTGAVLSNVQLRYFDDQGKLRTLAGAKPFSGDGKPSSLAKGRFTGLYYKKSSEPLDATYPEGLYFMEDTGGVFGYFDKATDLTKLIWGNQTYAASPTSGTASTGVSLGGTLDGANLRAMSFDETGRPWLLTGDFTLRTLGGSKEIIYRNVGGYSWDWGAAAPGTDPRLKAMRNGGIMQNLTLASVGKLFMLGSSWTDTNAKIRVFDYDNNTITHVMGDVAGASSPQQTTQGSIANLVISSACSGFGCALEYSPDQDRLYFTDGAMLRYITTPLAPSTQTLIDVFTASASITNFIVSLDRKYIFYIKSGALYCHAISAADNSAVCKNSPAAHINLGPPTGLTALTVKGPNQMTWKDNTTLFISTYAGEIYQYDVYH